MYVCMCVCTCIHKYTYIYIHAYIHGCTYRILLCMPVRITFFYVTLFSCLFTVWGSHTSTFVSSCRSASPKIYNTFIRRHTCTHTHTRTLTFASSCRSGSRTRRFPSDGSQNVRTMVAAGCQCIATQFEWTDRFHRLERDTRAASSIASVRDAFTIKVVSARARGSDWIAVNFVYTAC